MAVSNSRYFGNQSLSLGDPSHPLVTFAIVAYNQEKYIREAIAGAFSQNYSPLEIVISDDCSNDRTFAIIQEMAEAYAGSHKILIRRNPRNLGLAAHLNEVTKVSRGEIMILAAGDDVSLPDRTRISTELLVQDPGATAVLLSAYIINDSGKVIGERVSYAKNKEKNRQDLEDLLSWRHITFGAARAIRRSVVMKYGPLKNECPTEDTPFLLRSLMLGFNVISQEKSMLYRKHGSNLSSIDSLAKMNTAEIYNQYEIDIGFAERSGDISSETAGRLRFWIAMDRRIRDLRLLARSGKRLTIREIIFFAKNRHIRPSERIKVVLKNVFAGRLG